MKEKVTEYEIAWGRGHSKPEHVELSENVRKMMEKGWQPYGSPYAGGEGMYQAMVKFAQD